MQIETQHVPIDSLGAADFASPLVSLVPAEAGMFSRDSTCVIGDVVRKEETTRPVYLFERAGQRRKIFFQPAETRVGVVTCGGLCPGINNVIRSLVLELFHRYGVQRMCGFRFGYQGLNPAFGYEPTPLHPDVVDGIENVGGTFLGSSRGSQDPVIMVDTLVAQRINVLFCIGGDGTQRGAHAIAGEVARRKLKISIIGIPKTIDNDIPYCERSFGYATAIDEARGVMEAAHVEAKGAFNGVGLLKLMGRDAGFIAAGATVAAQESNFTLVPEMPFELRGSDSALLPWLKQRLLRRHHAVIVVAEGAGQKLFEGSVGTDASGNRLHHDIGLFLRDQFNLYMAEQKVPISVKYIDPSYIIRSVPANSEDAILCDQFARMAAHAAMAGKTNLIIGLMHGQFVHVPISMVTSEKKRLDLASPLWRAVQASTGQPAAMV